MLSAGIYNGLSMQDYLDMPAVSASLLCTTLDYCPAAAWHESWMNPDRERETSDELDVGTVAHSIFLEGSTAGVVVIDPNDHPAEKGGGIPKGWSNKSIRFARDAAREQGKIPVLKPRMAEIQAMADAARAFVDSLYAPEPAIFKAFQDLGGDSELTMVWDEAPRLELASPLLCRIRPDRISRDRRLIVDAKFTDGSANPNTWGRAQLIRLGFYVSAAFYRRGVAALCGGVEPDYVFLVVEMNPPHLCSLVGVDPAMMALGEEKVRVGLDQWERCTRNDIWPSYPRRVVYPELPMWEANRWAEQQGVDAQGIPYDVGKLFERKR
jgi:PDDEXK-like domain of unknown function (DUF3799)